MRRNTRLSRVISKIAFIDASSSIKFNFFIAENLDVKTRIATGSILRQLFDTNIE